MSDKLLLPLIEKEPKGGVLVEGSKPCSQKNETSQKQIIELEQKNSNNGDLKLVSAWEVFSKNTPTAKNESLNLNSAPALGFCSPEQHNVSANESTLIKQKPRSNSFQRTPRVNRLTGQYYILHKDFDPFKSPPSLEQAELHRRARIAGEPTEEQKMDQNNYCPCCYSIIEKKQFPISCEEKDLSFLGVGIAQIFLLNKYFGFIVMVIFTLGGSLSLLVKNQINCADNCLKIGGIAVLDDKDGDIELMSPLIQTLVAMAIIGAVLYAKKKINKKINKFNEGFLSPSEYTIMVQNLPLEVRQKELTKYFEKLTNKQIVRISMAFDTEKYNSSIEQKAEDIKQFNMTNLKIKSLTKDKTELQSNEKLSEKQKQKKLEQKDNKIKDLERQNASLSQEMKITDDLISRFEDDCISERDPSKFIGTAFITFNDTVPVNTIIEEWGYTYKNIMKYVLFRWANKSPFIEYKKKILIIRKAPAPADVIWENLRYSLPRNVVNNTLMLLLSCVILYCSFRIQFLVMEYVYPYKKESYEEHSFMLMIRGSLLSICVVIVNLSLRNTVFFFTKSQKFDHHTKLLNAYINKYVFLYVFNSAFMPYLVHGYLDGDNINTELLVWDIHFIILATSISTPLSKVFDPVMYFKIFKRWHIKSFAKEDCPYTQKETNYWFEGHPIEVADSYAYMARVLFLGAWYAQVAPFAILVSMLGLVCNHYIDKYTLLRINSEPEQITEDVYSKVLMSLDLLPFVYLCGGIEYETKRIISTNVFSILFKFTNQSFALVGLFLSLIAFIFHQQRKQNLKAAQKENRPYSEVRALFHTEYDRCNPVTQLKASNEYIQFLYKQKVSVISNQQEMEDMSKQLKLSNNNNGKSKKNLLESSNFANKNSNDLSSQLKLMSQKKNHNHKHLWNQTNALGGDNTSSDSSDNDQLDENNQKNIKNPNNNNTIDNESSLYLSNVSRQGTIIGQNHNTELSFFSKPDTFTQTFLNQSLSSPKPIQKTSFSDRSNPPQSIEIPGNIQFDTAKQIQSVNVDLEAHMVQSQDGLELNQQGENMKEKTKE